MVKDTADIWETASYTWMWLDPLDIDSTAFESVNTDRFMEAKLDIFQRCAEQHKANLFADFAELSLSTPVSGRETSTAWLNRLFLHKRLIGLLTHISSNYVCLSGSKGHIGCI